MKRSLVAAALALSGVYSGSVEAKAGDPVVVGEGVTIDPIVDGRLRYEHVDHPATGADALTMRVRAGAELKVQRFAFLAEAEGTLGIVNDYNAFPFAVASRQRRPQFSVVADPMNIELNRLQMQYKSADATVTIGRQRINMDDQRWVGTVGWRQNEQTFDAVRAELKLGPVALDGAYAVSQRTQFGVEAGPRQSYEGDFFFGGAAVKLGGVNLKSFAYILDYEEPFLVASSSQTYGVRATANLGVAKSAKLALAGSYARQSDHGSNPYDYAASYAAAEAVMAVGGLGVTMGYELLGSNRGRAVQTPMATLFKFNGWADSFLTTPAAGLQDYYGSVSYRFDGVKALPGLNAGLTYHRFDSDAGDLRYGHEWNAVIGFRLGMTNILARYAEYDAQDFSVDTRKFWLQAEFAF